jgi:hypothetical protein
MINYNCSVKYQVCSDFSTIEWTQADLPTEIEALENILVLAKNRNIPLEFIQENGILFIEKQINDEPCEFPIAQDINFEKLI